jgi:hypothetical protein
MYETADLERKVLIMSRTRFATLSISVMLVLGAGGSSIALAHEFIVNGLAIKEAVEVRGGGGVGLEAKVAKLTAHIGCAEGLLPAGASNVLEEAGKFKAKIELKACGVDIVSAGVEEDIPTCQVPNFNVEGTGELTEGGIATMSGVGASKVFAKIAISEVKGAGACTLAGTYELRGITACDIPDYLVTIPGIVIGCDPLGNKEVKLGSEPTKLDLGLGLEGAKGQTFSST